MRRAVVWHTAAVELDPVQLLDRSGVEIEGANTVVLGRSNIVGMPAALLLVHRNATVTICHSRTADLAGVCRQGDILCAAVGRAKMITGDMIKPGAAVIDFGINFADGKMVGDVDYESAAEVAGLITPVPGGTGPMTNMVLVRNVLEAARGMSSPPVILFASTNKVYGGLEDVEIVEDAASADAAVVFVGLETHWTDAVVGLVLLLVITFYLGANLPNLVVNISEPPCCRFAIRLPHRPGPTNGHRRSRIPVGHSLK